MEIFKEFAPLYHKLGLPVIPVDGKQPKLTDWSKYGINNYADEYLDYLTKEFPNCGIGLVLGEASGVMALDLDTYENQDKVREFIKLIGAVDIGKFGKKGVTLFYKYNGTRKLVLKGSLPEKYKDIDKKDREKFSTKLEFLAQGQQTILPPSLHPDTAKPYKWLNDSKKLSNYDVIESLPTVDLALITDAFHKVFGHAEKTENKYAGRNDHLKAIVHAMAHRGKTPKDIINEIILADEIKHKDAPLFQDHLEWPSQLKTPLDRAQSFVMSNYKTYLDSMAQKGQDEQVKKPGNYEQIGFYYRYQVFNESTGKLKTVDVPQYELMANTCFEAKNMCFDDSLSLTYDGKKWTWYSQNDLNNFIIEKNLTVIKPSHIDNFKKMIRGKCNKNTLGFLSSDGLINVNNGIIDVKTGELLPHSYKYLFKYCSPVNYDTGTESKLWDKFLLEVFNNDIGLIKLVQLIVGYILIGGRPFLHKAFVLYGSGRNGKSTFLDIVRALIGAESYSTVSMSKLDKEFSIVAIDGKLANIVEETPTDAINAEVFKSMVGGGEVQAAHKGFDEYKFRCNARFLFACNEMPIFKDKSVGLEDRLLFIPFNRYFKEEERDTEMTEKLLAELPGILNWALQGAKEILKLKKLPVLDSTDETKELYRKETDALYAWFCEEIEVDLKASKIEVKDVYNAYTKYCEDNGNRPYNKFKFSKRFRTFLKNKFDALRIEYNADAKTDDQKSRVFEFISIKSLNTVQDSSNTVNQKLKWYEKQ